MAAPTFLAEYGDVWNSSTTPKTASVTTAAGDLLVVAAVGEMESVTLNLPTGGTPTYANQESLTLTGFTVIRMDTAVTGITAQTYTLSQTATAGTSWWGNDILQFSGSDGIGAAESTTNAGPAGPSLAITTLQDNSAIVCVIGDWNAADGATRTWRTVNSITPTAGNGFERAYFRDSARYTAYVAYWPDAGAAGAKTVGISSPATMKYTIAAVEVKGTAAVQGPPRPLVIAPSRACMQAVW